MNISGCAAQICWQLAVATTKILFSLSVHVHLQSVKPVLKLSLAVSSENLHPFSFYLVHKAV